MASIDKNINMILRATTPQNPRQIGKSAATLKAIKRIVGKGNVEPVTPADATKEIVEENLKSDWSKTIPNTKDKGLGRG